MLISTFTIMSLLPLERAFVHCHTAKSLFCASRYVAASFILLFGPNTPYVFDRDRLWLFHSVSTMRSKLHRANLPQYRAWYWSCDYSVRPTMWMPGMTTPLNYPPRAIAMNSGLVPVKTQGKNIFCGSLWSEVYKQMNTLQHLLVSPCITLIPLFLIHICDFEIFWNTICFTHNDLQGAFGSLKRVFIK